MDELRQKEALKMNKVEFCQIGEYFGQRQLHGGVKMQGLVKKCRIVTEKSRHWHKGG